VSGTKVGLLFEVTLLPDVSDRENLRQWDKIQQLACVVNSKS